jgi:non-specific serine/threonine protein kinase
LLVLAGTRDLFYKFGQRDGLELARRLLARAGDRDEGRALALLAAGELAIATGDLAEARTLLAEGRALSVELGTTVVEAWTAWFQGVVETQDHQLDAARRFFDEGLVLHRLLGIRTGATRALTGLGGTHLFAGEPARAAELYEEALAIHVDEGDRWGQGMTHTFLGMAAEPADPARATSHYRKAVDLLRPFRDTTMLPVALLGQAGVLVRRDPAAALKVLAAASAIRDRVGGEFQPTFRDKAGGIRAAAGAKLGAEADRLWEEGGRLSVDAAAAVAFGTGTGRPPPSAGGLSARELEVARLVAGGLANKAIAAQLHLSVRTVEVHVRHILRKLGLDNRTQLAAWAARSAT